MAQININFDKVTGKIKPMHAVGQPPFLGMDFSYCSYLEDAYIPYSRLHDVGGKYGRNEFVDIPNIFRDFKADENDPESYDFEHTDYLIEQLYNYKCAPIFRLGVTIENDHKRGFKAQRINPPSDFNKWARICEHIVRHYNEGWADGFHYGIEYWEIWNEPENKHTPDENQMWTGTPLQYYELYDITSKHLKASFGDSIKVGGYAATGLYYTLAHPEKFGLNIEKRTGDRYEHVREEYRMNFLYGFLDYIKEHNSPIDFFSWHSYASADDTVAVSEFVDKILTEYGLGDIETHLNEWNNTARIPDTWGTSYASCEAAKMLLAMQNTKTSMLCYYDARIGLSAYGGMFNPITKKPYPIYYAFKAFGYLYTLKNQCMCDFSDDGIYAVSAKDGNKKAVMITNTSGADIHIETNLSDDFEIYIIDEENFLEKAELSASGFTIKKDQVVLIKN